MATARPSTRGKQTVDAYIQLILDNDPKEPVRVVQKLSSINAKAKISALKARIEKDLGVLEEMYYLSYLDNCPLEDKTTLKDHFFVSGSLLRLQPWDMWEDLLHYCYTGDCERTLTCMSITGSTDWNRYCAWAALYIASHRGHHHLVARLLKVTDHMMVNNQSPLTSWTALHAAARMGHWRVLCILLDNGADVRIKDSKQLSAFDLAREHGHKKCENSLNFCQWNLQKHHIVQERSQDYNAHKARRSAYRQAHLHTDSAITPWMRGPCGQLYTVMAPNTVSIHAVQEYDKKKEEKEREKMTVHLPSVEDNASLKAAIADQGRERFDFDYGWFDKHRARHLLPGTDEILTYANPSANRLQPRSLLNPHGLTAPSVNYPPPTNTINPKRYVQVLVIEILAITLYCIVSLVSSPKPYPSSNG